VLSIKHQKSPRQRFILLNSYFILSSRFSSEKVSGRLSPDKIAGRGYNFAMSASEIIKELPKLSEAERRAILDKLRELAQQDDERWEQLLNDPRPRPKLEAFLRESAAEGESPLDPSRL
jgi:uncharacterized protein YfbU (UPF0304 family)